MAHVCPDCSAELAYEEQPARLLTGHCAGCGKDVTLVAEYRVAAPRTAGAANPESDDATDDVRVAGLSGPECEECGTPLDVRISGDTVEAECTECETTLKFVSAERAPERAPMDRGRRPSRPFGEGREEGPPRSRPCRQCGGALEFTTGDDGVVTGSCSSCGNRFTLPPRREGGGSRDFRGGGFRSGGYRGGGYRGGGRSYGARSSDRGGGRSYGRRPADDDDRRRRRRIDRD